jgi:Tfp pilus assembly protein FimT
VTRARGVAGAAGVTLVELMFTLALGLVIAGIAVPQVLAGVDRSRTRAAARFLAARMTLARAQAVARAATVALRFTADGQAVAMYVDGNGNGVRTRDVEDGRDPVLEPPVRLGDLFPGVMVDADVGAAGIVSFTAAGTASSGTVYLRGRERTQAAVRVLGATGRTRVLRYDPATGRFDEGS